MSFADLRSCLVTATGWTFDYVNDTDLCEVLELFDYWQDNPPAHMLLRAFVEAKTGSRLESKKPDPATRPAGKKLSKAPKKDREIFEMLKSKQNG